nr:hypothetical protein [Actinopolymorpha alba]
MRTSQASESAAGLSSTRSLSGPAANTGEARPSSTRPRGLAGQELGDLLLAWQTRVAGGLALPQPAEGARDHAVDAVRALARLLIDERLLQGMRRPGGPQPVEGLHARALRDRAPRGYAGPPDLTIDEDGAGSALRHAAPELRAALAQRVP